MKLLLELRDKDIGMKPKKLSVAKKRTAARAVLLKGRKIALLHVTKENYHKLPGGGLEGKESSKEALFRELLEETGCKAKIICDLGKIIEHRTHINELQTSYCYIAKITEEGTPKFDQGEIEAGFEVEWVDVDNAIDILGGDKPTTYDGKFIVIRDLKFLKTAKNLINSGKC